MIGPGSGDLAPARAQPARMPNPHHHPVPVQAPAEGSPGCSDGATPTTGTHRTRPLHQWGWP